jgi:hypothetical protein
MVIGEATNTNFIIFDVTRPVFEFTRCTSLEANTLTIVPAVQFEDNYGIKSHKLKKNRQYNDQTFIHSLFKPLLYFYVIIKWKHMIDYHWRCMSVYAHALDIQDYIKVRYRVHIHKCSLLSISFKASSLVIYLTWYRYLVIYLAWYRHLVIYLTWYRYLVIYLTWYRYLVIYLTRYIYLVIYLTWYRYLVIYLTWW